MHHEHHETSEHDPILERSKQRLTTALIYGRLPLVFGGMLCAIVVMWTENALIQLFGVALMFGAMILDLIDKSFANRLYPRHQLRELGDRVPDRVVYSMLFPLVAVGIMWRFSFTSPDPTRAEMLHAILVMLMTVTVMVRDNFAYFMRRAVRRQDVELEYKEFTRLRTIVTSPIAVLLYTYAFCIPYDSTFGTYNLCQLMGFIPLRIFFFIEIIFIIINFASIAGYIRRYNLICVQHFLTGNERLRLFVFSFIPNALTVMNAVMGLLAVFFTYQDRVREASMFLVGAAFFDKLDGAVARRLKSMEPLLEKRAKRRKMTLGGLLDDFADSVSFCIAPAWMFYIVLSNCGISYVENLPLIWIALIYASAGILRLVYFTTDKKPIPGFFKGMPTTAAALLIMTGLINFDHAVSSGSSWSSWWGMVCSTLMVMAAALMNLYPIRYLHLGRFMSHHKWITRLTIVAVLSVFTPWYGYVIISYMMLYVFSPIVTWRIPPEVAAQEGHAPHESHA